MGWSIGFDANWQRDIGYGVPAYCDHPGCGAEIDRGLSYVCGDEPYGGEHGCGLFFCPDHNAGVDQRCERCRAGLPPFNPTDDHPDWIRHKLTDGSWRQWRDEHPAEVDRMKVALRCRPQSLREEIADRPGDWAFIPPLIYGLLTLSWRTIIAALLICWAINILFGKKE